ncbi:PREDICTED: SUMO-activating enzyme subunit 2-like [Cyphomyrmex costatus]|uniref:SUMO-activating enzyme subunit 2 n=1 Tax=Cyphomyrmex costatus TaxID=456900 RepID=A0A151IIV4_9HYME|nr:PREDICTED: SUMO-activating enzyme subunit 2-like [Cyphomyrmex costatus]KYN02769.1 SUMO-activating enzyme subunit 2 [Cyphomyrmex costatus]
MAGNIIPAIVTTNAIIAGIVVLYVFRVLENNLRACRSVYLRLKMNHRNQLLVPEKSVNPPNPQCYVCAPVPQATLAVDTTSMTIKELEELVLKNRLNMIAPDVMIDGTGAVVISSEEGEMEGNNNKKLEELGIKNGTIFKVDDFQQNYSLTVFIIYREKPDPKDDSPQFLILADKNAFQPKENEEEKTEKSSSSSNGQNVIDTSKVAKKRKNNTEAEVVAKKRSGYLYTKRFQMIFVKHQGILEKQRNIF